MNSRISSYPSSRSVRGSMWRGVRCDVRHRDLGNVTCPSIKRDIDLNVGRQFYGSCHSTMK